MTLVRYLGSLEGLEAKQFRFLLVLTYHLPSTSLNYLSGSQDRTRALKLSRRHASYPCLLYTSDAADE